MDYSPPAEDDSSSKMLFPRRHCRGPRSRFIGQSGTTLGNPPEQERFAQHGDCSWIDEVCRCWVKHVGEHTQSVQLVAVAVVAVLKENGSPLSYRFHVIVLVGIQEGELTFNRKSAASGSPVYIVVLFINTERIL